MDDQTTLRLYHEIYDVFNKFGCDNIEVMATYWAFLRTKWLTDNPGEREIIIYELELHKDMVLWTMLGKRWSGEFDTLDKFPFK
jgi:hypothetical protein